MFRFRVSKLIAGEGRRAEAGSVLRKVDAERVALITGVNTGNTQYCRDVIESIEAEGIEVTVWRGVKGEPDDKTVMDGVEFVGSVDAFVAFGGGSVMDTAKLINFRVSTGRDFLKFIPEVSKLKPMLAIPTTFGTGSETTCAAVIRVGGVKRGILHESLLPDFAILDWEIRAPRKVAASAGMDAIMHAFEAYTCVHSDKALSNVYSGSNEVTDALAIKALKLLKHLPEYVNEGKFAREIAVGSNIAGMAFGNAGVHFGHAASYAIASLCNAPHGVCVASIGQALLEWMKNSGIEELERRAREVEDILSIDGVRKAVGLPSLAELVSANSLDTLVERTMKVERLIAMRPEIDEKAARKIFEIAFKLS